MFVEFIHFFTPLARHEETTQQENPPQEQQWYVCALDTLLPLV